MKKNIKYGICIIILILIVCIIIFISLERSKRDTTQEANRTNIEETSSKSAKNQEPSVSNSNIEIESYNGKDAVLYKYTICNNQGKKIYEDDDLNKEPVIEELDDGIISIGTSAGTGLWMVKYYDKLNARVSDIFTNPLDLKGEKVIYFDKNKIVVQNVFNKSNYYKEIKLDTTDTADPNNAIKSAEFIDDDTIRVIYFSGTDYKEVTEIFHLNK
jgi:hypothetical protein